MKKISVVVPVYNEEAGLSHFHAVLSKVCDSMTTYDWQIIYVNDGSGDKSEEVIADICKQDSRAEGIILSRNFGKEIALTAGLDNVTGDAAIFMDADLQHPPEIIPELIEKWESGNYVVATIRKSTKKKSLIKHLGSKLFYYFMSKVSEVKIIPNTTDFKLLDKRVLVALRKFTERNRMFRGLVDWMGFKTDFVHFVAPERFAGEVSYSFSKLSKLAINSFTSFSLFPLKVAGYLGLTIFVVSSVLLIVMMISRFAYNSEYFSSISFVIVGNTLVLGITLMALGMIALYIGRIHDEVINRPLYIVREHINIDKISQKKSDKE